jgi:hypothetical protein
MLMGPTGPGTRHDFVGEGRRHFTRNPKQKSQSHYSVRVRRQTNMAMGPAGPETRMTTGEASRNLMDS